MGVGGQPRAPAASTLNKDPLSNAQEAGWAPGPVWTGGKSRSHRDSIPDRPACRSVAIPTELPGPHIYTHTLEGNGTLVPSNRAVAELRLRPLGLWNLVYTTETVSFNSLIDRCQISLEITTAPTQSKG